MVCYLTYPITDATDAPDCDRPNVRPNGRPKFNITNRLRHAPYATPSWDLGKNGRIKKYKKIKMVTVVCRCFGDKSGKIFAVGFQAFGLSFIFRRNSFYFISFSLLISLYMNIFTSFFIYLYLY